MKRVRIRVNIAGVRALRKSPGVSAYIDQLARDIAREAGPGFIGNVRQGRNRVHGSVIAMTEEAVQAQARHHVLERAIGRPR